MRKVAACGAVLVALAAGCGGSSNGVRVAKSAYDLKLEHAGRALSSGLAATFSISSQPRSPSSIASEARRSRAVLNAAAAELANARPPSAAKRDTEEVLAALRFVSDEIAEYAKAAAAGDWRSINQLNRAEAQSTTLDAALGALADLRKKGHEVGAHLTGADIAFPQTGGNWCSGSSDTVTAPSVIGQPEQEAVRHLREAGLDATVFPQIKANPHVPEGVVVHESPLNFPLCKGTSVWLIVSIGK